MGQTSPTGHSHRLRQTNRISRAVALLLLLGLLALAVVMARVQFDATRQSAEVQAHRTAHVVATQFAWMLQASAQALQRIEDVTSTETLNAPAPYDISGAVRDLPPGLQHSLYDRDGRLILSSVRNPSQIDVSDRAYFLRARAGEELLISPMVTERLTGDKVFIVARRIDSRGDFAGVATIAIPAAALSDLARDLDLSPQSTISLIGMDGMLIVRAPPIEPVDLSDAPLFKMMPAQKDGTYTTVSPVDKINRIVGFWRIDGWPVVAVAGLAETFVYQGYMSRLRSEIITFTPLFLALIALCAWIFRLQTNDERRESVLVEANRRNDFLMREIHHRVKNNLQTVMSLIRLETMNDPARASLLGRISAMVAVHQEIYGSDSYEAVDAQRYLSRLMTNIAKGQGADVRLGLDIAAVELSSERALQLGLLVNELATNAYKHAFNGRSGGRLEVRLAEVSENELELTVTDDGPGTVPGADNGKMGSRLISAFVSQLGGTMTVTGEKGLRVAVRFPRAYGTAG